jgi:periplasmic protein TonB
MSDSAAQSQREMYSSPAGGGQGYTLSDDLAKLCLPREFKDSYRKLAYANSICALFLAVGLVGLKAPQVITKPLSEIIEPVPVVFTPPTEPPRQVTQEVEEQPEEPTDQPIETPQVVSVVAAADAADVAFAVPVQGAVAIAPTARFVPPPPPVTRAPSAPVAFNPVTARDGGSYPPPTYPGFALRNRQQGTVVVEILVDAQGKVTMARVQKSSGYPLLDEAAVDVVQKRWRFPGGPGHFTWACVFQMQ